MIVLVHIPLLDAGEQFEIFEAHSLPVPMQQPENGGMVVRKIMAEYELEAPAIAINKERSKYILLRPEEARQCIGTLASHCAMRSPTLPVNLSKACIVALFMRDLEKRKKNCQVAVKTGVRLPLAEYLSTGVWIITTDKRLLFTIICQDGQEAREDTIEPPIGVISLPITCKATNSYLSLPAYFRFDSMEQISDPHLAELRSQNLTSLDIWNPVHTALPTFNFSKLPSKLRALKRMPVAPFIAELQGLETIQKEFIFPSWGYVVIVCGTALLIGGGIAGYIKRKRKLTVRERESGEGTRASEPHLVAAVTTLENRLPPREPEPAAPLLGEQDTTHRTVDQPSGAVEGIARSLYPRIAERVPPSAP